MKLHPLWLFSCCALLFCSNFIGPTWMIASPLEKLQFFALGSKKKKKKRILLTPRSLCWVHYSCPRPRMRTDIDLILRWKLLCTSARLTVGWGLVMGAIKRGRVGWLLLTWRAFLKKKRKKKEASRAFIFRLNTSPPSPSSPPVHGHRLGLDLPSGPGIKGSSGNICSAQTGFTPRTSLGEQLRWS